MDFMHFQNSCTRNGDHLIFLIKTDNTHKQKILLQTIISTFKKCEEEALISGSPSGHTIFNQNILSEFSFTNCEIYVFIVTFFLIWNFITLLHSINIDNLTGDPSAKEKILAL